MKRWLFVTALVVVAFFAGRLSTPGSLLNPGSAQKIESMSVRPRWVEASPCDPMSEAERAEEDLALHVLRTVKGGWIHIGAVRHLGLDRHHSVDKQPRLVCKPTELDAEIARLALEHQMFVPDYLHADPLRLARRLGPRDLAIVEVVARTAFNSFPISTQYPELREDIRSLARVTLAEFGAASAPWAEQAFKAMSANDALGTSAAAIAVAGGSPEALSAISRLLDEILDSNRKDPIPRPARERFYELAYALAAAGPKAQPYAKPLLRMMVRQVESWAPPFGMVALRPRRMCRVLEIIGLEDELTKAAEVCHPKVDSYEK